MIHGECANGHDFHVPSLHDVCPECQAQNWKQVPSLGEALSRLGGVLYRKTRSIRTSTLIITTWLLLFAFYEVSGERAERDAAWRDYYSTTTTKACIREPCIQGPTGVENEGKPITWVVLHLGGLLSFPLVLGAYWLTATFGFRRLLTMLPDEAFNPTLANVLGWSKLLILLQSMILGVIWALLNGIY